MKEFEPTVAWLKSVLPRKYADEIYDRWCWPELGEYYSSCDIPDEIVESVARAVIARGDEETCYLYCRYIEDREDMVKVIRDSGSTASVKSWYCYLYCVEIGNREDLAEVIRDSGSPHDCYTYCRDVEDREDMAEVIRDSGNSACCQRYCDTIRHRDDMWSEYAGY